MNFFNPKSQIITFTNIESGSKYNIKLTNFLVLVFIALGLIGVFQHEMWQDELQAWMIARHSFSIEDLLNNLRYEGHPGLWHLCLYGLSRLTRNPVTMQIFHLLLATGSVYLFSRFSPFTTIQKTLFIFGYFCFYEYALVSRSYALGVILIFGFCSLFTKYRSNYLMMSVILALLANTSAYGFIIAVSLQAFLALDYVITRQRISIVSLFKKQSASLAIFATGVGVSLIQILSHPNRDYSRSLPDSFAQISLRLGFLRRVVLTISSIWGSYVPVPKPFIYEFWNTNILLYNRFIAFKIAAFLISIGLLWFSIALIKRKIVIFPYLFGVFGILLLNYIIPWYTVRHHGHLFIWFIACLWISRVAYSSDSEQLFKKLNELPLISSFLSIEYNQKLLSKVLTLVLFSHFVTGLYAYGIDLIYPFSSSRNVVQFIRQHQLSQNLIAGFPTFPTASIAALLDQPIYYLQGNRWGSFVSWGAKNTRAPKRSLQEVIQAAGSLSIASNLDVLLISGQKIDELNADLNNIQIKEIAQFTRSIVVGERYYLYWIDNLEA